MPNALHPYWTFREELNGEDSLVLKGTRVVNLHKKHEPLLRLIHEGHIGSNKYKLHAKGTVYWLGLNDKLEKLILNCEPCLRNSQSKCK